MIAEVGPAVKAPPDHPNDKKGLTRKPIFSKVL